MRLPGVVSAKKTEPEPVVAEKTFTRFVAWLSVTSWPARTPRALAVIGPAAFWVTLPLLVMATVDWFTPAETGASSVRLPAIVSVMAPPLLVTPLAPGKQAGSALIALTETLWPSLKSTVPPGVWSWIARTP